jgi:hypothetical protein
VTLFNGAGASIGTTATNGAGLYSFTNLASGSYSVGITLPAGYLSSPADRGGDDLLDSDINPATGRTAAFSLVAGQTNLTIDAGIFVPVAPSEPDLLFADDSGGSQTDDITNVNRPRFTGTARPGALVTLLVNGVANSAGTADGSGAWMLQIASPLGDGIYAIAVAATGATSGNMAPTLKIDRTAPTGTFTILAMTIEGQLATRDQVLLTLDFLDANGLTGGTMAFGHGTTGTPSFGTPETYGPTKVITIVGADGLYTVAAKVTDVAGNEFTYTYTRTVRLDTTGPAINTSSLSSSYRLGQTITLNFSASDADDAKVKATLDPTSAPPRSVTCGNDTTVNTPVCTMTIATDSLTAGVHSIVLTGTDALGNISTRTISFTIVVDASGLIAAVNDGVASGKINRLVGAALNVILSIVQGLIARGQYALAKLALQGFETVVSAAASRDLITGGYGGQLVGWSASLRAQF